MNIIIPQRRFKRRDFLLSLMPIIAASRRRSSYLVSEDFDGTGTPSGWVNQNGVGTVDWDNTTSTSPQGGQCLFVASNTFNTSATGAGFTLPTPLGSFGYYAQIRCGNVSSNRAWYLTDQDNIYFRSGNTPLIDISAVVDYLMLNFTWYHIWLDRTPTSKSLYVSTTATKPESPSGTRTGSFANATKLISAFNSGSGVWLDKVRVSASPIGSNPA